MFTLIDKECREIQTPHKNERAFQTNKRVA